MALPAIENLNTASMLLLSQLFQVEWMNPQNPSLDFLSRDFVRDEGYTDQSPLWIGQNVLQIPIAAAQANPRMRLPVIDGQAVEATFVNHFELNVPLSDVTMDEYEKSKLTSSVFGSQMGQQNPEAFAAEAWTTRMAFGKASMNNMFEVKTMSLIEEASIVTSGAGEQTLQNDFVRKEAVTVADLSTDDAAYVDLTTAGALAAVRWVNADGTLNASAEPVQNIQAQISTIKRWGGGGVKGFVMDSASMKAYNKDFVDNYKDLVITTVNTMGNAQLDVPAYLAEQGWTRIGYVHDFSDAYRLIPVYSGNAVKYRNWMNSAVELDFLPSHPFCFPIPTVPTIGRKYTWVKLERVRALRIMCPVNVWEENQSGARQGQVLFRGAMYPRVNPNALVFWRTG